MNKKKTILDFRKMKEKGEKITWITSYDFPTAYTSEQAGVDMILVGDSGGMTVLGYDTTNPVTMDEMVILAKSVERGAPNTFRVGDMPQGSYEASDEDAVLNAMRFVKESSCSAVKLEGGERIAPRMKAITQAGIMAIAHCALTPQSQDTIGGYRVCCKTLESFEKTLSDCYALQEAGASMILLEGTPEDPAGQIAAKMDVPVLGIGCGGKVDGQLIIWHDLMGFYHPFRPYFAECYIPKVINAFSGNLFHEAAEDGLKSYGQKTRLDGFNAIATLAIKKYVKDVQDHIFPTQDYIYPLQPSTLEELKKSHHWDPQIQ